MAFRKLVVLYNVLPLSNPGDSNFVPPPSEAAGIKEFQEALFSFFFFFFFAMFDQPIKYVNDGATSAIFTLNFSSAEFLR